MCSLRCRGQGSQHLMFDSKGNSEMLGILCHQVNNLRPLSRSKNQSPTALIWGPWELWSDECAPQLPGGRWEQNEAQEDTSMSFIFVLND